MKFYESIILSLLRLTLLICSGDGLRGAKKYFGCKLSRLYRKDFIRIYKYIRFLLYTIL